MVYGNGTNSTVDAVAGNSQIRQEYYNRMALLSIKDEMYLQKLSGTMAQPKNYGKEVVKHRYIALLSDENSNAGSGLDTDGVTATAGNLYGSSRGTGFIAGKLPDLGEDPGRANKVSFSRKEVRGNIVNRGFFFEYSKDELNFDSDKKFKQHITTEAVKGASQINEDVLAIDLVNNAGVNYFAGDATTVATIDATSVPTLQDLIRLDTELDNNKCPRDTKVIVGSTLTDTKTVANARYMFIHADTKMDFMSIKALNGTDDAFVPVEQYQSASGDKKYINTIHGEIGKVGPFRLVVHPMMVKYATAADASMGAAWSSNATNDLFRNDGSKFEAYPCLVVGSEAFTHIAFEYGAGTQGKFKVVHKTPEELRSRENPFGKVGMTVIEFWNGILIERPEWIAVYNISAKY